MLQGGRQAPGFSQNVQDARHRGQGIERRLSRVRWPAPTGGPPEGFQGGGTDCVLPRRVTERDVIGVIEILDPRRGRPQEPNDLDFLAVFARQAALALESVRVFSQLGRALFAAAAHLAEGEDVVAALERVAAAAGPSAESAQVTASFAELARLGPKECAAASELLRAFLAYVRARDGQ
jgi:hypothetical protein